MDSTLSARRDALLKTAVWFLEDLGAESTDEDAAVRRTVMLAIRVDDCAMQLVNAIRDAKVESPSLRRLEQVLELMQSTPILASSPAGLMARSEPAWEAATRLAEVAEEFLSRRPGAEELVNIYRGFLKRNAEGVDLDLYVNLWHMANDGYWQSPAESASVSIFAVASALSFGSYVCSGLYADKAARPVLAAPGLPTPMSRSDGLTTSQRQLLNAGVEPLIEAAHRLLDRGELDDEDEAELRALADAVQAEGRNPRSDVVTLERSVARLAAAVTRHGARDRRDDAERTSGMAAEARVGSGETLREIVLQQELGDPDSEVDLRNAIDVLDRIERQLSDLVAAVDRSLVAEPTGPLRDELSNVMDRIERSRSATWPTSIAQNLTAAALLWVLGQLGIVGVAVKALVWMLIAIYQLG